MRDVVRPAVDAVHRMLADRLADDLHGLRPREVCAVGLAQVVLLEEVRGVSGDLRFELRLHALLVRDERLLPFKRNLELPDVLGSIPANQASWSSPGGPYGALPTAQVALTTRSERRAAQASACGPPPRPAGHPEPLEAELVRDHANVVHVVDDSPTSPSRRAAVARSVVGRIADAEASRTRPRPAGARVGGRTSRATAAPGTPPDHPRPQTRPRAPPVQHDSKPLGDNRHRRRYTA